MEQPSLEKEKMKTNIFLIKKNKKTIKFSSQTTNNIYINRPTEINKYIEIIKKTEINIYDKTKKQKQQTQEKIRVNNHINRTGKNPLRSNKNKKIKFYDITNIYKKTEKGITTTCLGERYNKEKENFKNPSTTMCHVVFILRSKGYKKIKGWLIPTP